jgi:thiol:disulfide interchange protein
MCAQRLRRLNHSAIATLVLVAIAGWMLFPARRPRRPLRDWSLIGVIAVLGATSIYQLIWLQAAVLD